MATNQYSTASEYQYIDPGGSTFRTRRVVKIFAGRAKPHHLDKDGLLAVLVSACLQRFQRLVRFQIDEVAEGDASAIEPRCLVWIPCTYIWWRILGSGVKFTCFFPTVFLPKPTLVCIFVAASVFNSKFLAL